MPLYSYICETCGEFEGWQSMSQSLEPVGCDRCGNLAPRALSAPYLAAMPGNARIAHARNEKAAHEPQVVKKKSHSHDGHAHPHRHGGHGCSHGHGRPWMIGH
ncbi:MAG: FmdB family zinc ribbon protein [Kiloniellales bacterium]|jgi:putative FmdB family regulatory protein|nr:FmdB family zinc ribbon protein [Kiloniellales bacterium]